MFLCSRAEEIGFWTDDNVFIKARSLLDNGFRLIEDMKKLNSGENFPEYDGTSIIKSILLGIMQDLMISTMIRRKWNMNFLTMLAYTFLTFRGLLWKLLDGMLKPFSLTTVL
jgi:hypothetical protein